MMHSVCIPFLVDKQMREWCRGVFLKPGELSVETLGIAVKPGSSVAS